MDLQSNDSTNNKYNNNIGEDYRSTISPKDGKKAFSSSQSELEELKKAVRFAEMDIIRGNGDKEKLKFNILIWEKRIKVLENAIKLESLNKTPHNEILNKINYTCQHCFKNMKQVYKCPKCSLDLCFDHLSNHSCTKSSKVHSKFKNENVSPIQSIQTLDNKAPKVKKAWWKFW